MLRHNVENDKHEKDEVELSRRSFFSRLAIGAVLSVAVPGVVHAAKSQSVKEDKKHRLAQSNRGAVRLPKHAQNKAHPTSKAGSKQQKLAAAKADKSGKVATAKNERLHTAKSKHSVEHNTRVRDVYTGQKQGTKTVSHSSSHTQNHGGKVQSIIHTPSRQPIIEHSGSPFVADHGRLVNHRSLAFQNPHTGDKLNLTYFEKGRYLNDALDEISFLLRDYRTGDTHTIDTELLDQLHDLKQILGLSQPFDVICGYRSPMTNAKLHAEHSGVANNSFHMYGRAVDIRIERFDLRRIHNAAVAMHRGGVGYYPDSNFIHLDTGTFRTWSL